MKVDVKLAGNSYSGVPSVLIPLKSGGKARFCEVSDTTAKASDVAQGKTFYDADGNYTRGSDFKTCQSYRLKIPNNFKAVQLFMYYDFVN